MVCALLRYCARWCEPALPRVQVIDQPTKGQVACAERSRCDTGCARARARTVRAAREQAAFSSAVRSPCARPALALRSPCAVAPRPRPAPAPRSSHKMPHAPATHCTACAEALRMQLMSQVIWLHDSPPKDMVRATSSSSPSSSSSPASSSSSACRDFVRVSGPCIRLIWHISLPDTRLIQLYQAN